MSKNSMATKMKILWIFLSATLVLMAMQEGRTMTIKDVKTIHFTVIDYQGFWSFLISKVCEDGMVSEISIHSLPCRFRQPY